MNRSLQIELLEMPQSAYIQPHFFVMNKMYFDIDDETKISLFKAIQQLADFNKINVETILGTSLPGTVKNFALLNLDINFTVIDPNPIIHNIVVDLGFHALNQNGLRVISYTKATNRFEIEILDNDSSWVNQLKKIYLNDLPFQSYIVERTFIKENQAFDAEYETGDRGYYFGLCHYGGRSGNPGYSESDFRPLIHSAKIYELAFQMIKRSYSFPLIQDTEVGRRTVNYLLRENINDDETTLEQFKFKAQTSKKINFGGAGDHQIVYIIFDKVIFDNGNNYDPTTGEFKNPIYAEFVVEFYLGASVDIPWLAAGTLMSTDIFVKHADGSIDVIEQIRYDVGGSDYDVDEKEKRTMVVNILVQPGDRVGFRYKRDGDDVDFAYLLAGAVFYCNPISLTLNVGDTVDVRKSLRHDPIFDFMKGDVDLYNIKILEERHTGRILFLTPFDADYFGDVVSGYMRNVTKSFLNYQIQQEEIITTPIAETRNRCYKFKDSTDAKINEKKVDKWKQIHSKFIDNGFDPATETDYRENPYFEPTMNGDPGLPHYSRQGTSLIDMPFILDNLEGKVSYKSGPRKMIAFGLTEQFNYSTINGQLVALLTNAYILGEVTTLIPYCAQLPNAYTINTGSFPDVMLEKSTWKIVYGNFADDNYEKFIRRWWREIESRPKNKIKNLVPNETYMSEQFRDRVEIMSLFGAVYGRFLSVSNYNPETRFSEYEFVSDVLVSDECDEYVEPNPCKNFPTILYDLDSGTYTVSQGGLVTSPIDTVSFRWKLKDSSGDWTDGDEIINPFDIFIVEMTITYQDGCPEQKRTLEINPCNNAPKICFAVVDNCLVITECGTHTSTIDNTVIEYSETQAEPYSYKTYNDCIDLDSLSDAVRTIHARITVTYSTGCKQLSVEDNFIVKLREEDCPKFDSVIDPPSVIGVTTATGFKLVRTGTYNGRPLDDFILYRKKNSKQDWRRWIEGQTPLPFNQNYEAERKIIWCGRNCEPWCGGIVYILTGCIGSVNITDSFVNCTHALKWVHPDTGLTNWKTNILNDNTFHVPELKTYIETVCGGGSPVQSQIKKILKEGIMHKGISMNRYVDLFGAKGTQQNFFRVYKQLGKQCPNCNTIIVSTKQKGRTTYYCPECQK
jgi:hypothetical protein